MTALVGLRFLTSGMRALNEHTAALAEARRQAREREERESAAALAALSAPAQSTPADPADPSADGEAVSPVSVVPAVAAQAELQPAAGQRGANGLVTTIVAPPMPPVPARPLVSVGPDGRPMYQAVPLPHVPARVPGRPQPAPGERPASMTLLNVWILLFGFVGTQLAWTLRPFLGSPDKKFEIFRAIEGNFYVDMVRAIGELFT
jgi:hypothetical protein